MRPTLTSPCLALGGAAPAASTSGRGATHRRRAASGLSSPPRPPTPHPSIPPLAGVPATSLPRHLALILDGNRRWARARGLPDRAGHAAGVVALTTAVQACLAWGIPALTVYGFSVENWGRTGVLGVAAAAARAHAPALAAAGVRLRFIPRGLTRPRPLVAALRDAEAVTDAALLDAGRAEDPALRLTVALSYSSRSDLGSAAAGIAADAAAGRLDPATVDASTLASRLSTAAVLPPDLQSPDLIIRTGGERRLSNFLLFEAAYAELSFLDEWWPDVGVQELGDALRDYAGRERRFGRDGRMAVDTERGEAGRG